MINSFIKNIDPQKKSTWQNKKFLSFDMEWAPDFIMESFIELIEEYKVYTSIFLTNNFRSLKYYKKSSFISLEIHPNFNKLLEKNETTGNYLTVLKSIIKLVPGCKVIRSHGLTQNSKILNYAKKMGITHDSNDIVFGSKQKFFPYKHFSGLIKAPITWEDDIYLYLNKSKKVEFKKKFLSKKHINIFNFHPLSIFINVNNYKTLNFALKNQNNYKLLKDINNNNNYGIKNFFEELVNN